MCDLELFSKIRSHMMKFLIKYSVRKKLLNLKGSKLGQILRADKTGFCRLSHICSVIIGYLQL